MGTVTVALGAVLAIFLISIGFVLSRLLHVAGPGEILVVSGSPARDRDGRPRPFRWCVGGRLIAMPLIERVDRIERRIGTIDVELSTGTADGASMQIRASVVGLITSDPGSVPLAIERFLGLPRPEVLRSVRVAIEASVRDAIAVMSAAGIEGDRAGATASLRDAITRALAAMGVAVEAVDVARLAVR